MAVRFSTKLRNEMLGSGGFNGVLGGALATIEIYSGVQPTSADAAPSGTKLLEITVDADGTTGLSFGTAASGTIAKAVENWKGVGIATGVAGWARLSLKTDTNVTETPGSETWPRLDMSVAKTGADLNISNTSVVTGAPTTIDVFQLAMAES